MNPLERFLRTDPRDAGCAETMRLLHVYVDARLPGIAAHLEQCSPCSDELEGLLQAARASLR